MYAKGGGQFVYTCTIDGPVVQRVMAMLQHSTVILVVHLPSRLNNKQHKLIMKNVKYLWKAQCW